MKSEDLIELYIKSNPHLEGQKMTLHLFLEKRDRDLKENFKKKNVDIADFRVGPQASGD